MTRNRAETIYDTPLPEELRLAVRVQTQAQIIECLNRFYMLETEMWGKPVDALIVRMVVQGRLQGRLYDLSALSAALGLPIATLHRKVADLVEGGHLRRERRGKSVYLVPTDETCGALDESFEAMVAALRRLYRGGVLKEGEGDGPFCPP
ncbi:ArsR family transcriptional regulator [Paracoccus binzhouensis]|uniref:ArsR family transcriptional regulator n=1 Tax=Paracoccus binzhouensis TaxID=2796149 RepID=UPI0018EEE2A6|nr:ArsR family transcriptional regulator [Paracoccus binzhouensis]